MSAVGDVLRLGPHDSLEIRSSTPEQLEVVDGEELRMPAGAELEILRGQVHQMWNPGEVDGPIARGEGVDFPSLLDEYSDVFRLVLDG
jgi:hypothetical protein